MLGRGKFDAAVTLVAAGTEINGDLRFDNQLYLNGRVVGNISAPEGGQATVIVSDTGSVTGDIRVPNVVISGRVEGNVHAAGRIELGARARVIGNVHYRLMEMQLGAQVEGQLLHHETEAVSDISAAERNSGAGDRESAVPQLKPVTGAARQSGA
jgi:cytoskeletal protein CcmA (bactofilin family)